MDKVYYISRCQLKTANKQFTTLKNDYEMTFTPDTVVAECTEDTGSMPSIKYDFVPITDIANKTPDTLLGKFHKAVALADRVNLNVTTSHQRWVSARVLTGPFVNAGFKSG